MFPAAATTRFAQRAESPSILPDGVSPYLELVVASPEEITECVLLNKVSWSGPLSEEAYLRREAHLRSQTVTANGGLTGWILVDKRDSKSPRTILAACESLRKRAFVAQRGKGVKEVQTFGVGSVYCREEYRGKGYALRMMAELRKNLESWQQAEGKSTDFTILYSDIGKKFYAKNGWIPYPSAHISLKPGAAATTNLPHSKPLFTKDLPALCRKDEALLKQTVAKFSPSGPDFKVALVPTSDFMDWHHAREEFLANELLGRTPKIKGAIVDSSGARAVWCVWTRLFPRNGEENSIQILRIAIEDEDCADPDPSSSESVQAVGACLAAAQEEALAWSMKTVELWNPSPTVLAGVKLLDPKARVIHREQESVACLNWYGERPGTHNIQWVANEKFGWC